MRALSNLINLNQPDLVLFVGEALVGNDAGGAAGGLPRVLPRCIFFFHFPPLVSPFTPPHTHTQTQPPLRTPRPPFPHPAAAVDQLTKFNQRLADLCPDPTQRHLIDGIVLTKFDTIDDKVGAGLVGAAGCAVCTSLAEGCAAVVVRREAKCSRAAGCTRTDTGPDPACPPPLSAHPPPRLQVGAALSMVYTSGAPIMFVGCGQTYVDLKKLHVRSVVQSLLK